MFEGKLKKQNDKIIFLKKGDEIRYREFIKKLKDTDIVTLYMEVDKGNGTLSQLAKVHKMIRIIANETGHTFEEIKLLIKHRAGLVITKKIMGNSYVDVKSFADVSKDDLSLAIQACLELGEELGIIL